MNENFDALFNTFNTFPSGKSWGNLASYTHWEFNYDGELWVSDKLFPVMYWSGGSLPSVSALFGLKMVHQGNTTNGTTTIVLKQRIGGSSSTIDTLTVPTLTAPFDNVQSTAATSSIQAPADGTIYYLDVTAVGAVPPSRVTIYMAIASYVGG